MFASILDRYPQSAEGGAADRPAGIERALRDQFEAGMGMLADGLVWDVSRTNSAIDAAVAGWNDAARFVRALAEEESPGIDPPLVKACVLGPWSATREHDLRAAARRVGDAVDALFEAGAPVVQLVEDGLASIDPNDTGTKSHARDALQAATHQPAGHLSLSVGGGSADWLGAPFLFELPFASYAFDLIRGPDNWRLIAEAPSDRGILCGVADAGFETPDEQAVMTWAARYAASTGGRGLERVALCPSSGLEMLSVAGARMKLDGLAAASRTAGLPPDEIARAIDPHAVDARTAALGRFESRRRSTGGTVAP